MHKSIHSLVSLVIEADGRGLFVLQASACKYPTYFRPQFSEAIHCNYLLVAHW